MKNSNLKILAGLAATALLAAAFFSITRDTPAGSNAAAGASGGPVRIHKSLNGHILVEARLAGRNVWLLVDTGASESLYLDAKFVRDAGLTLAGTRRKAYGLEGAGVRAADTTPVAMTLGDATRTLPACVLDLSGVTGAFPLDERPAGILGSAFLEQNRVVIDYAKMRLSIADSPLLARS